MFTQFPSLSHACNRLNSCVTNLWITHWIAHWSTCNLLLITLKPINGLQAMPMDKPFKYNSRQPLIYTNCHQLPKPNMETPCYFTERWTFFIKVERRWAIFSIFTFALIKCRLYYCLFMWCHLPKLPRMLFYHLYLFWLAWYNFGIPCRYRGTH